MGKGMLGWRFPGGQEGKHTDGGAGLRHSELDPASGAAATSSTSYILPLNLSVAAYTPLQPSKIDTTLFFLTVHHLPPPPEVTAGISVCLLATVPGTDRCLVNAGRNIECMSDL